MENAVQAVRLISASLLTVLCLRPELSQADALPRDKIVLASALSVDPVANRVVLPLHKGRSGAGTVWYIVTDSSDRDDAARRGAAWSTRP